MLRVDQSAVLRFIILTSWLKSALGAYDGNLAWTQVESLTGSQSVASSYFSSSISLLNNISVIGAYGQDNNQGLAYVFLYDGITSQWSQNSVLTPQTPISDDSYFGGSSALSDNWLVVGAYGADVGSVTAEGRADIYSFTSGAVPFTYFQTVSAGETDGKFGYSLALLSDYLFVGAPAAESTGVVYVYQYLSSTWSQLGELHGNDTAAAAAFGTSVAATDGWVAVGAPQDGDALGLVYIYKPSASDPTGFTLSQTLHPSQDHSQGRFGWDLDITNGFLIASDPTNGEAYTYLYQPLQNTGWYVDQILVGSSANDFGASVRLSVDAYSTLAAVGSPGSNQAYVYFFHNSDWTLQQALTLAGSNTQFGYEVAIQNGTLLISSTDSSSSAGAAYVYTAAQTTFSPTAQPTSAKPSARPTFAPTAASVWTETYSASQASNSNFGQSCSVSPVVSGLTYTAVGWPTGSFETGGAISLYTSSGTLQTWTYGGYVNAINQVEGSYYGISSASNNQLIVVGQSKYDVGSTTDAGTAYSYILTGGYVNYQQTLSPPNPTTNGEFGKAIAATNSMLFIGEPAGGTNSQGNGYAYVLVVGVWKLVFTLTTTFTDTDSAGFGTSVDAYYSSTSGNTIAAFGAPGQSHTTDSGKGAVITYVFTDSNDDTYIAAGSAVCPDPEVTKGYGNSVAVGVVESSGLYFLAVGSPNSYTNNVQTGAVYMFTSTNGAIWSTPAVLISLDAGDGDNFGYSVDWDNAVDESIIVGAPFAASGYGEAYVFNNKSGTWTQSATLNPDSRVMESGFGTSVCMTYGLAVVGAPNNNTVFWFVDKTLPTLAPTVATDDSSTSDALSPGAVAGVVIGVLGGVAIISGLVYFLFLSKPAATSTLHQPVLSPMNNYGDAL